MKHELIKIKQRLVSILDSFLRNNRRFTAVRWLEQKLYPNVPECVDWDAIGEDVYPSWN